MSLVTERIELLITSSARGVANEIKGVGTELDGTAPKLSRMEQGLQKAGLAGVDTGTAIKGAIAGGIAVGGAAIAKFAVDGIEKFASLTSEVRGFQRVSQTSAEDASKLVFASKQLGIESDTASTAIGRLATRIGSGKANLDQYGVSVAKNKDGTVDMAGTLANLSEKYQSTGDATERAAIGNEAFGRSWQKLAPLLGKGKEDLQAIFEEAGKDHQIFSQEDLETGRQFTLATHELSAAWQGLQVEAGKAAIPTVTAATKGLTAGIHAADDAFALAGTSIGDYTNKMVTGFSITSAHAVAMDSLTPKVDRLAKAQNEVAEISGFTGEKTKALASAQHEATSAAADLEQAQQKVATALQNSAEKTLALQVATLNKATADIAATNSVLGVEGALNNQEDAQAAANEATYNASVAAQVAADAHGQDAAANFTAAAAAEEASRKNLALKQAHESVVTAAIGSINAAGNLAVMLLGPHASGQEKAKAGGDAMRQTYDELIAQFPELRGQLGGYIDKLNETPHERRTRIFLDGIDDAIAKQEYLLALYNEADGRRVTSYVDVIQRVTQDGSGAPFIP